MEVTGELLIRALRPEDCERLVRIDRQSTGRLRTSWYEGKVRRALRDSDVHVSLCAEQDGLVVGAVLGSVQYGEFGQAEPVAILDTVLVDPEYRGRGIASALLDSLLAHLAALRIERLRTEAAWDDGDMISFFARAGFVPVPRLVLEMPVPLPR